MTQPSELTQPLRGKVVAVTGAGRGIGRGISIVLAKNGADVVVVDVNPDEAEQVVDEMKRLGRQSFFHHTDVTLQDDVEWPEILTRLLVAPPGRELLGLNQGAPTSKCGSLSQ